MIITLGRLFGITIRMHVVLPLFLALALIMRYGQVVGTMMLVLSVHEWSHALMAIALGLRVDALELMPFGGVAHVRSVALARPAQEAAIAMAGPLANLLMAMAAVSATVWLPITGYQVQLFVRCNIVLLCANLLPVLPLDGGRALRALLQRVWGTARVTKWLARAGMVLGLSVFALGIWGFTQGVVNVTLLMTGCYLCYAASLEEKQLPIALAQRLMYRETMLAQDTCLPAQMLAIHEHLQLERIAERLSPRRYYRFLVLDDQLVQLGELDEKQLLSGLLRNPRQTAGEWLRASDAGGQ